MVRVATLPAWIMAYGKTNAMHAASHAPRRPAAGQSARVVRRRRRTIEESPVDPAAEENNQSGSDGFVFRVEDVWSRTDLQTRGRRARSSRRHKIVPGMSLQSVTARTLRRVFDNLAHVQQVFAHGSLSKERK
jgi:hypothetical protein